MMIHINTIIIFDRYICFNNNETFFRVVSFSIIRILTVLEPSPIPHSRGKISFPESAQNELNTARSKIASTLRGDTDIYEGKYKHKYLNLNP